MHILLVGLNHRSAPLEVRERVSFSGEQINRALPQLRQRVGDSIILSTCNRTEVYSAAHDPDRATAQVLELLSEFHNLGGQPLSPYVYERQDEEAARHLFRVASGLDSMVIGESEILGQVRNALLAASETHRVQVPLSRLFHGAIRSGRRVREETSIGRNALSVSYAGVRLVERVLGDLRGLTVLLVGAGEAGELVAKALRTSGVRELAVSNRTAERAEELARQLSARPVSFDQIKSYVEKSDVLITATEAPQHLFTLESLAELRDERASRPLFILDLGVPRNVDPRAARLDYVRLHNIDDLSAIAEENLEQRRAAAQEAEALVEEELTRFMKWWGSQEAVSAVRQLQVRANEIRQRELQRALQRLPDLTEEEREAIVAMSRSLVRKLLHDATVGLKESRGKQHIQAIRDLFKL